MIFIHGFRQWYLIEKNITHREALLIAFLLKFYSSGKMKTLTIDNVEYKLIRYKYLQKELPILFGKKREDRFPLVSRLMKSLKQKGIISTYVYKKEKHGSTNYFTFSKEFLIDAFGEEYMANNMVFEYGMNISNIANIKPNGNKLKFFF